MLAATVTVLVMGMFGDLFVAQIPSPNHGMQDPIVLEGHSSPMKGTF